MKLELPCSRPPATPPCLVAYSLASADGQDYFLLGGNEVRGGGGEEGEKEVEGGGWGGGGGGVEVEKF